MMLATVFQTAETGAVARDAGCVPSVSGCALSRALANIRRRWLGKVAPPATGPHPSPAGCSEKTPGWVTPGAKGPRRGVAMISNIDPAPNLSTYIATRGVFPGLQFLPKKFLENWHD